MHGFVWDFVRPVIPGCRKDEGEVGQGKEVAFRISRFDETFSRATATNFEVGDSIGIYAVKHDATGGNSFPALSGNQAHKPNG